MLFCLVTRRGEAVKFNGERQGEDKEKLLRFLADYKKYKSDYAKNIKFDPETRTTNLSRCKLDGVAPLITDPPLST